VLTILHGDALVFHSTNVAAELVLPIGVFYELRLDGETPHLF